MRAKSALYPEGEHNTCRKCLKIKPLSSLSSSSLTELRWTVGWAPMPTKERHLHCVSACLGRLGILTDFIFFAMEQVCGSLRLHRRGHRKMNKCNCTTLLLR